MCTILFEKFYFYRILQYNFDLMANQKIKISVLSLILSVFAVQSYAQNFGANKRYWSVGGCLNAMNYVGDLDPADNMIAPALRYTRPNLGAVMMYRYAPRISFRGAFSWGMIGGNDRKVQDATDDESRFRYIRGANFSSHIVELKGDVVVDLFENRGKFNKRPDYTPYGFVGLAFFYHSTTAEYGTKKMNISDAKPEGTSISPYQVSVPFGIGFRYKLSKQLDLSFEIGWRKTFTGNLDGVNKNYQNPYGAGMTTDSRIFSDPSMVGYGSDSRVTTAINRQGFAIYDPSTGVKVGEIAGTSSDAVSSEAISALASGKHVTPIGYGWTDDKRGEDKSDWYIVTGFHLTYILVNGVRCPKFR